VDALHKATPLWVNTISQQVVPVVHLSVYLKCHVTCGAAQQVMDQGGPIQDIKVIVRSGEPKINVPNVQVLVSHNFQDNGYIAVSIAKITLPSHRAILPLIMHAIQRAKHTCNVLIV
jgi:hypothetical protein